MLSSRNMEIREKTSRLEFLIILVTLLSALVWNVVLYTDYTSVLYISAAAWVLAGTVIALRGQGKRRLVICGVCIVFAAAVFFVPGLLFAPAGFILGVILSFFVGKE